MKCSFAKWTLPVLLLCQTLSAATFTNTPTSVSNTYNGTITLQIGGLTNGETVTVQKYLDDNANGVVDAGDLLIEQFNLTDGQSTTFTNGGVLATNFNVPGDADSTSGHITAVLDFQNGDFSQTVIANYLLVLSSPTGHFNPITNSFNVTNTPYAQSFTGSVVSNGTGTALPGAVVLLFHPRAGHHGPGTPVAGVAADNSGNYSIQVPTGTYTFLPYKKNYLADSTNSPTLILTNGQSINTNLSLTPATETISGVIENVTNSSIVLPGTFTSVSANSLIGVNFSDGNGNFSYPVTANVWGAGSDDSGFIVHGYVGYNQGTNIDTTGGSVSNVIFPVYKATAMFYGNVQDGSGNPVAGLDLNATDNNNQEFQMDGYTDTNGNYAVGVVGGLGTNDPWQLQVSSDNAPANYLFSQPDFTQNGGTNINVGQAIQANFTAIVATNLITGHLLDGNGNPIAGVGIFANATINGASFNASSSDTDTNGFYSINVANGDWNLSVNCCSSCQSTDYLATNFLCPDSVDVVISNNNGTADFSALVATNVISGTVLDNLGNPITGVGVSVSATINSSPVNESADTDNNGNYSIYVANGDWSVSLNCCSNCGGNDFLPSNYQCPNLIDVPITNNNGMANFTVYFNNSYNVAANASPGGGGVVVGTGSFEAGSTQTLSATANAGFEFSDWTTTNGDVVTNIPSFSFVLSNDVTYVAHFTTVPPGAFTLGTTNLLEGSTASSDSVVLAVSAPTNVWMASTTSSWLHLSAPNQSGVGSTNVIFTYDSNPGATRFATIIIAGQTLTVTQAGSSYIAASSPVTLVSAGLLGAPFGVAVDGAGNVYFSDTANNAVDEWTTNNTTNNVVFTGLSSPEGLAVDGAGNIYIADSANLTIDVWSPVTSNLTAVVTNLNVPTGVALDSSTNLYISTQFGVPIHEWSATTSNLTTLATPDAHNPLGVAVDSAGNVYIADTGGNTIQEWMAATSNVVTLVDTNAGLASPTGVAVDGAGNVYFSDTQNVAIKKWTAATGNLTTLVSEGLTSPEDVAVDGAGNIYFADYANQTIQELPNAYVDTTGKSESTVGGVDTLPPVLPAAQNLAGPFAPTSDQSWLTILSVSNGAVTFAFSPSTTNRTGHITLLGQSIAITQTLPPQIQVFNGINPLTNSQTVPVNFGTVLQGQTGSVVVFTITNSGSQDLSLNAFGVPAGFTIVSNIPGVVTPGASSTLDIQLDSVSLGSKFGYVLITNNDPTNGVFAFPVSGDVIVDYTLTTSASPSSGGAVTSGGVFAGGTIITNTATASNGFVFSSWTSNNVSVSQSTNYVVTLNTNVALVAHFLPLFNLTVSASPTNAGSVSPGGGTFASGTIITNTATASNGYAFSQWTSNGVTVSTSPTFNLTLVTNVTLVADFMPTNTITVVASPANGGTVNGGGIFALGTSNTVTASANAGFIFTNWTVGGSVVSTSTNYGFTLASNVTVTANFLPVYTITVTALPSDGGMVSGGGTFTGGSTNYLTATNNSGFEFAGWSGGATGTNNPLTVVLSNNVSITATFLPTGSNVTVIVVTNGSGKVLPFLKDLKTNHTYTLTATASNGNVFSSWTGSIVTNKNPLTFKLESSLVLEANFVTNPFLATKGSYNGLFFTNSGVTEATAGMLKGLNIATKGTYSGTLLISGGTHLITGTFDLGGQATNVIKRPAAQGGNLLVEMNIVTNSNAAPQVTGLVSGTNNGVAWQSSLQADLATNTVPSAEYTLIFAPDTNNEPPTLSPGGASYVLITNNAGTAKNPALASAKLSGALADGTAVNQSVPVSADGYIPVYQNLYDNKGLLLGWVNLVPTNTAGISLTWIHPTTTHGLYQGGFTNLLLTNQILLALWTNPLSGITGLTNLILEDSYYGSNTVTNAVITTSATGLIKGNEVSGSVNLKTGYVKVSFGAGANKVTAYGAISLESTTLGGYFLTKTNAEALK